jgi:NADH-quinone oxidoreductase subunit K
MLEPAVQHFMLLGAILFVIGAVGAMVRKNVLVILMCIELMLNAVNLTFLAFALRPASGEEITKGFSPDALFLDPAGQVAAFFVLAVAAAEAAVGLAIIVAVFRSSRATSVDEAHLLKW